MSEHLIFAGLLLVFIGIFLMIIGSLLAAGKGEAKVAVGGFIGPIPFGWANDPRMLKWIMIVSVIVVIMFLVMLFIGR